MDVQRAKKIAESFSQDHVLSVEACSGVLVVHYRGKKNCFKREGYFLPFLYRIAGVGKDIDSYIA
ncbi:MAG: hypothetical protein R8K22_07985 [Mariprofundaceae bacterium]